MYVELMCMVLRFKLLRNTSVKTFLEPFEDKMKMKVFIEEKIKKKLSFDSPNCLWHPFFSLPFFF